MRNLMRIVISLCCSLMGTVATARPADYLINHWACEAQTVPVPKTAIGCVIVDTVLGCPPGATLSVRVHFTAPTGSTATLTLSPSPVPVGLTPGIGQSNGTAQRLNQTTFSVTPGDGVISGFQADPTTVPFFSVKVDVPPNRLVGPGIVLSSGPPVVATATVELKEVVGDVAVDETSVKHVYYTCQGRDSVDKIKLTGDLSSAGAVALVDASTATGCTTNLEFRGSPFMPVGNLKLKPADCVGRVSVFLNNNGAALEKNVSFWTNGVDQKLVAVGAVVAQPVRVWLLYDYCSEPASTDVCENTPWESAKKKIAKHVSQANRLFLQSYAGIRLEPDIAVISDNQVIHDLISLDAIRCYSDPEDPDVVTNLINKLATATGQTPQQYSKHLNVFYVRHPIGYGQWCGQDDPYGPGRDTILMDRDARLNTLAHEIGHAFLNSGAHVDDGGVDGFNENNVAGNLMLSSSPGDWLTVGQLFRANMSLDSTVIRHGARTGAHVTCSAADDNEACPDLSTDISPR